MARKMKDSGIEWIGEIPEGWEVVQLKRFAEVHNGREIEVEVDSTDSSAVGVYGSGGVFKYTNRAQYNGKAVLFGRKGTLGKPLYVEGRLWAVDTMYFLTYSNRLLEKFSYYQFLAFNWAPYITHTAIPSVVASEIVACYFPIPPLEEQKKIADYLDNGCASLDAILDRTRSSIEEYKKLKQAVITQAVTKGVRGEREMKDSGVEWIGEIPKEWRKTQLRHCAAIKSGITLGKSYSKDTVLIERPYLRVANVQGGYVDLNDLATIEVTPDEDLKYRLHFGDVLMTEGGDRDKLGRGCVWHGEIESCLHQNHVFAVQTNETILLPEFLEYLTASDVGRSYFDITAIKTTNLACTSSSKVLAFTIPLPPIEEQIEIVGFIKKRSLELNKLIMKKELLVQELENYKKSLIYEVVTGKREV